MTREGLLRAHQYHTPKSCQEDLNARFGSKPANFWQGDRAARCHWIRSTFNSRGSWQRTEETKVHWDRASATLSIPC